MIRFILATWAALAGMLFAVPASAETWHKATTDNFVLYSTGSQDSAREAALKLERFDALLRLRYRIPSSPSPNPLTIYLLDSTREVMGALADRKRGGVAGYYSDQIDGSYAVSHRTQGRRDDLNPQEVLFHEYGHHFMFRYFPFAYPGWYREGFAEYYATTEFDEEGNWNYGKPPRYRGATLMGGRQISVEKMLTKAQRDLSPQESYQVYTRGWLLVHLMHSRPERNRQLSEYLLAIARGESREDAANSAFGDLDELERELRRYMGESPTYIRSRNPIDYKGSLEVITLDDIDSEFEQLRLDNRRTRGREETRDKLARLAEKAPDRPYIWNELADAQHMIAHTDAFKAWRDLDDEDAEKIAPEMGWALQSIDRALAVDPDNGRAHALKAEFLMDVARHSEDAALWESAREHAITANRLNPDNPFPLALFYDSYADAGVEISDNAHAALARAFELAPEVDDLRVEYALDLAMMGDYERAIGVVEFLVGSPHSEKRGRLALQQIEAIRGGTSYLEVAEMELPDDEDEDDDD